MASYATVANILLHKDTVNCLGFSEDGIHLASGDDSGLLVVSRTQDPANYDKYHLGGSITALVWIPGSQNLYVGLATCDVILISLDEERAYRLNFRPPDYDEMTKEMKEFTQVNCLAFDPSHSWLAVGVGSMTVIASVPDLKSNKYQEECVIVPEGVLHTSSAKPLKPFSTDVRSVHFLEEGRKIIISYLEEGIRCYSIRERQERWRIVPKSYRIGRTAIDNSGRFLVCSNLFDGFDIYRIRERNHYRNILHQCSAQNNVPLPVLFIHDDDDILLGSGFGQVNIMSVWSDQGSMTLNHGQDMIQAIAFTDALQTSYIATACAEKGAETYVRLWALRDTQVFPRTMAPNLASNDLSSVRPLQHRTRQAGAAESSESSAANSGPPNDPPPSTRSSRLEATSQTSWATTFFLAVWMLITFTLVSLLISDGDGRWPFMPSPDRGSPTELVAV